MQKSLLSASILCVAFALTACGGSSSSSDTPASPETPTPETPTPETPTPETPVTEKIFSTTATEFVADFTTESSICYDLESKAAIACADDSEVWDIKFNNDFTIQLNGGLVGSGKAGAYGPNTYDAMNTLKNGAAVSEFTIDKKAGTLLENSWYGYNFDGNHKIWPNYRVYAIKSHGQEFKLRMTGYYNETGDSGFVSFDYQDISLNANTAMNSISYLDASAGGYSAAIDDPKNKFTYYNLVNNTPVELTDSAALQSSDWDIAFKRTQIKINSASRTAASTSALAASQDDFYDAEGQAIPASFINATADTELEHFTAITQSSLTSLNFIKDENVLALSGYNGWYNYNMSTHAITAKAENHWIIRSSEESLHGIFNITEVVQDGHSASSYTVNFYLEEDK
jgi:hypothetical protein